ncbi:type VII secretion protein EssA [Streptococcus merionis]|uniref:type VII secretion protein EssA n=1 Tax=Streptococcus merionis TaxID=400065 RepID=UPI0035160312
MKKMLGFLLLSTCFLSVAVYADDGSLKIDTDIHSNQESKEIHYIEQESELAKLFRAETSESIQKVQGKIKDGEKKEREHLFLERLSSEDIMEVYQPLLFTSKTMISNTGDYHISLNAKSSALSWQMLGMLSLGFCVMGYSIIRVFTRKKGGK